MNESLKAGVVEITSKSQTAQEEIAGPSRLHEKMAASPRGAVALPVLSCMTWLQRKFVQSMQPPVQPDEFGITQFCGAKSAPGPTGDE